jgi:ABC-type antimicrobial peptide transport system permease subunit
MAILQYYIAFLPLLIFAIFALLLFVKKWIDDHQRSKTSGDKLLRSAGDSRRVEIENIDAKINTCLIYIGIAIAFQIIGFTFLTSALNGAVLSYLLGVVSVTTVTFSLWYLIKTTILVLKRSRCSDGFHGECISENLLSVLMLDGYRVFHDLQFEGLNIDHALVGPAGVFAVETKLRKSGSRSKIQSLNSMDKTCIGPKKEYPTSGFRTLLIGPLY